MKTEQNEDTKMTRNEYNGWYNYETWVVKLWMDNDAGSQGFWTEIARDVHEDNETDRDAALCELAEAIKDQREEALPEIENSFASDLLNAAMSEVNWYEIAQSVMEDAEEEFELSWEGVTDEERSNGPRK